MARVAKHRRALTKLRQPQRQRGTTVLKRVTEPRELRQAVATEAAAGEREMAKDGYGQKLKGLRERAHLTQAQCAKALGIGQGGYSNYENEVRYEKNPIPADKAMQLLTLFVGKGTPPIRPEEVLDVTELRGIQNILGGVVDRPVRAAVPHEIGEVINRPNTIRVRYAIERGVYRDDMAVQFASDEGRSIAPVLPLRHYPHDQQWGAVIIDNSGQRVGLPKHTLLHCVDVSVLSPADLPPGSIVVALRRREKLSEVALCVVTGHHLGQGYVLKDASTDAVVENADVLGAAVYRYGPVAQA